MTEPSLVCTCAHALPVHDGACTGHDSYGLPCECPSFEVDRYWSGLASDEEERS